MNTMRFSCGTTLQIPNRMFKYFFNAIVSMINKLNHLIFLIRVLITVMSNRNETIQLKGIYKGAKVKRGPHWSYGNEVDNIIKFINSYIVLLL